MSLFEVYDANGLLQLSSDAFTVQLHQKYTVTGNFSKKVAKSCIAIQPKVNSAITIYPTQATAEDTANFVLTGAGNGVDIYEFINTNVNTSPDRFGLALYDYLGEEVYHSSTKPLKIKGVFNSSPYGIPHFPTTHDKTASRASKTLVLDTIPYPPGCDPTNTALFLSSVGCEGAVIEVNTYGMPRPAIYYYTIRPYVVIEQTQIKLGFSGLQGYAIARTDDHERYRFDGGTGHISGFFIDTSHLN